jgi:hypothetical protein
MVEPEEMLWIPVRMDTIPAHRPEDVQLALPSDLTSLEAVPGLWPTGATEGMICICNLTEVPVPLETGSVAAEVSPGTCSTTLCDRCGRTDTLAEILTDSSERCGTCNAGFVKREPDCRHCGAKDSSTVSYTGCADCKPEKLMQGTMPAKPSKTVLSAALRFQQMKGKPGTDTIVHPVHHIVEEPGGIEHLVDCECPSEE